MQTLLANEESKTGLDFLADLWSGRVNNTLLSLNNQLSSLRNDIQTIRENIEMKTQAEQALLDAAQMLNQTESSFRSSIGSMQSKIDQLVAQAQSPTATPAPEDLTEELGVFSAQLDSMKSYAASLESSASTVAAGTQGQSGTAPAVQALPPVQDPASPVSPNPVATDPETGLQLNVPSATSGMTTAAGTTDPASPTPLAGETGIGNTPTDNQGNVIPVGQGEVFAAQPQPGLDPSTTQPGDSSTGTGNDAPATTNQSASEMPGNPAFGTEQGVGGVTPNETASPETRNAPTSDIATEGAEANTNSAATTDPTASGKGSANTVSEGDTSSSDRNIGVIDESIG